MRACAVLALIASCGFPKLPPLTGDGGGSDGPGPACDGCVLAAVEPGMAPVGTMITLEGMFVDPTIVTFPGGATAQATLLGPNRATVMVPPGATTGVITVGDASLPFRTTTFLPALGVFSADFDQADYARETPDIGHLLDGATTAVIGSRLYLIGGETSGIPASAVLVATINADGTIGRFGPSGTGLVNPRSGATSTLIGNTLYVVGGQSESLSVLASVEAAPVMADGSLGSFAVTSSMLATRRYGQTTQVIGNSLYVIGGLDDSGNFLDSIEAAPIGSEGVLGAFTVVANLPDPRYLATSVVASNTLYVIGGQSSTSVAFDSFVQAPISGDGSLGTFTMPTNTMHAMRIGAASVVVDGTLYVIGGAVTAGNTPYTNSIDTAPIGSDGTVGAFVVSPNKLTSVSGRFASAVVGNFLYLIGGLTDGPTGLSGLERASLLSGGLGSFTELTSTLGIARHGHGSAVIGNYYYVIGGKDLTGSIRDNVESAQFAPDGTLGSFSDAQTLLVGRYQPSIAVIGDRLYVIGGQTGMTDGEDGTTDVEYATIHADGTLSDFTDDTDIMLGTGRYGAATLVFEDNVFVLGGTSVVGVEQSVEVASFGLDRSDELFTFDLNTKPLDSPTESATAAAIGRRAYLSGGADGQLIQSSPYTTGKLGVFTTGSAQLEVPLSGASNIFIGDVLYILGGITNAADVGDVETSTYSPSTGDLGLVSPAQSTLVVPRDGHSSTVIGNFVYVFGGENKNGVLGSIEQATLQ